MGKLIGLILVVVVAVGAGTWYWTSWEKVDPGNVGLLVDYGDGSIELITETRWQWIGRYQKLLEYSTQEQTLIMDMGGEGQVKGDDSTMCTTADSQQIKIDSATDWQIDVAQLLETYKLRRDVPLTGPRNRDAPGNYLEDVIVRNDVRSAIYKICPTFGWADIVGTKQQEFEDKVEAETKASAAFKGVQINRVTIRNRIPSDAISALMQARLEGQRQQEQSAFAAAQAKRQQEIDQAAAVAAGEKARIEAEAKARVDVANATAAAEAARVKSNQEAEAIRATGNAQAESLRAQASAVTPQLVDLERARKWNGQGPTTVLGSDTQVINQVPR
jgi:regulator of protease activity HflC (stomatin/prohibitin superfamily)